jgi:hypothetical protein
MLRVTSVESINFFNFVFKKFLLELVVISLMVIVEFIRAIFLSNLSHILFAFLFKFSSRDDSVFVLFAIDN